MTSTYKDGITDYCDDGNNDDGDGCTSTCTVEANYECIDGSLVKADFCRDYCGDGAKFDSITTVTGLPTIECDDGNLDNGDGCDENCDVEDNFSCDGGTSLNADRCWYTLRYKPAIENANIRSNGFIGLEFNDTLDVFTDEFTEDEISFILTDTVSGKSIGHDWKAKFATDRRIILEISPDKVIYGGDRSVLTVNFMSNVKLRADLADVELVTQDDPYSLNMTENPTKNIAGYMLGLLFHILFVLTFLGL